VKVKKQGCFLKSQLIIFIFIISNAFGYVPSSTTYNDELDIIWDYEPVKPITKNIESDEYKIYNALFNGELNTAIDVLRSSEMRRPYVASVYFNLGETYFRNKNYPKAIKLFRTFVALYKNNKSINKAWLRIGQLSEKLRLPRYLAVESYQQVISNSQSKSEIKEARLRLFGVDYLRNINKPSSSKNLLNNVVSEIKTDENNLLELKWLLRIQSLYKELSLESALKYVDTLPLEKIQNLVKFQDLIDKIYLERMKGLFFKEKYKEVLRLSRSYNKKNINSYNQKIKKLTMASRKIAIGDILEKNKG